MSRAPSKDTTAGGKAVDTVTQDSSIAGKSNPLTNTCSTRLLYGWRSEHLLSPHPIQHPYSPPVFGTAAANCMGCLPS